MGRRLNPGFGTVLFEGQGPQLTQVTWPVDSPRDDFSTDTLRQEWNYLRSLIEKCFTLTERPGYLRLRCNKLRLFDVGSPIGIHLQFLPLQISPPIR